MIRRFTSYIPISMWLVFSVSLMWLSLGLVKREVLAQDDGQLADGGWEFSFAPGYGERTQALIGQDDRQIYISVDVAYYRGRFFFDNGDLGWNLIDRSSVSVNLIGRLHNERELWGALHSFGVQLGNGERTDASGDFNGDTPIDSGAVDDEVNAPGDEPRPSTPSSPSSTEVNLPDRDTGVMVGLETILPLAIGQTYFVVTADASGTHEGQVVSAGYRFHHIWRRFYLQPSIDATWKSGAINDYYFGVIESEADEVFGAHTVGADTSVSATLLVNYALTKDIFLGFSIKYKQLGNQTVDSPLIDEDAIRTYFVGLKYQF